MLEPEVECPSDEDMAAYARGQVTAERAWDVELHVARCAPCRRALSELARAGALALSVDSFAPTLIPAGGPEGDDEPELALGSQLGRYIVIDRRGAGGMGVVYSARDPELGRDVALKLLRGGAGLAPGSELRREAQTMARLSHPNVVSVFDVGAAGGHVFIVMELIQGQSLARWLAAERRAPREIIAAFVAAGRGLEAAHAAGLVHRDFKPDNVMVGHDGRVCVTDFGLARWTVRGPAPAATAPSAAGHPSGVGGTLAYMAPEQYLGRDADARADQFSFAVALYEALHGARPYLRPWAIGTQPDGAGAAPTATASTVPPRIASALMRALSAAPQARYPSMTELLAALAPRSRSRVGPWLASIGVTCAVAAAVVLAPCGPVARAPSHAALVRRWSKLAPELRGKLLSARMLPMHDIRAVRDEVRGALREVERTLEAGVDGEVRALGELVLGEGRRALGDDERALDALEAAWALGERGPHIDAALGSALGVVYDQRLERTEQTTPPPERETAIRALDARYRVPAMAHLRAALALSDGSTEYIEALIAFRERRFGDASRRAHAVFAVTPTMYQAGALEALAHNEAGRQLLAAGSRADAEREYVIARQTFSRVLEIARSDEGAWLRYGDMLYTQANELSRAGAMNEALLRDAIAALHNVQRIDPDSAASYLREAHIELGQGNLDLVFQRSPIAHVERALDLIGRARALGADAPELDVHICVAQWELGVRLAATGGDPRPPYARAEAACRRAIAAQPDADKYSTLGVVHEAMISYDAAHGIDPEGSFELAEHNLRASLAISNDAGTHFALAHLWILLARFQLNHGRSPERAVAGALAETDAMMQLTSTRADAWVAMSNALALRGRYLAQQRKDPRPSLVAARDALQRAFALDRDFLPALRHRLVLAELEGEDQLRSGADPHPAIDEIRAVVRELLRRDPADWGAHLSGCRAELLAARWEAAHGGTRREALALATSEAARARGAEAPGIEAWIVSAEVELMHATVSRDEAARAAALARGLGFVSCAMAIDRADSRVLALRDRLEQAGASRAGGGADGGGCASKA